MGLLSIDFVAQDDAWPTEITNIALASRIARAIEERIEFDQRSEAVVAFSRNHHVAELNARYRGKTGATNVLSFPASDAHHPAVADNGHDAQATFLGDIILARETVANEASGGHLSWQDHTTHLIVHGVLHLIGYDHETAADANEMESLEIEILQGLGIQNPYTEELVDTR